MPQPQHPPAIDTHHRFGASSRTKITTLNSDWRQMCERSKIITAQQKIVYLWTFVSSSWNLIFHEWILVIGIGWLGKGERTAMPVRWRRVEVQVSSRLVWLFSEGPISSGNALRWKYFTSNEAFRNGYLLVYSRRWWYTESIGIGCDLGQTFSRTRWYPRLGGADEETLTWKAWKMLRL